MRQLLRRTLLEALAAQLEALASIQGLPYANAN